MAWIVFKVSEADQKEEIYEIGDTFSEEARGSIRAESFDDLLSEISERDSFAAKTIRNFAHHSSASKRESLIN